MRREVIGNQTLYFGDCFELMAEMNSGSVDLVLTDPPYGDNFGYGRNGKTILGNENVDINFRAILFLCSILKDKKNIYLFTNYKYELDIRNFLKDEVSELEFVHLICVLKNNFGMGKKFRNQAEYLLCLEKGGGGVYNSRDFSDVIRSGFILQTSSTHPHQKSTEVLNKIIRHSSFSGDTVFDPFMGSGSTLVSCQQTGRCGIGCELELKWFDLACKRVEQECKKRRLF